MLVLAGPGSGKTRVLAHRIAYLINTLGVRPYNILSVTFTNKAAREMENRVQKLLDQDLKGIWLGTFHGMCARILRREAELLPFDRNFVIFDDDDQRSIVRQVLEDLNLDEKIYRPASVHAAISNAKNNLDTPESLENAPRMDRRSKIDSILPRVYRKYQNALLANNAVDFDDLLLWTWRLLEENEEVRTRYARMFEHILVDEFQDTNMVQYELLRHLASYHQNIFVVGDEDQSIYRWRGADYRNVLRFEEDFPRAEKILLEQNYRSTQMVLDAATSVINQNRHRTPKRLRAMPERGQGERIVLHVAVDDIAEASYVVDTIQQAVYKRIAKASDFAVMYRTNAQSRLIEEAFLHAGMPYRLVGAQRFYGRREIKDMIAYLRLVQNPFDSVSLLRVINVPPRKIGDRSIDDLRRAADRYETSAGQILLDLGRRVEKSDYWGEFPHALASKLSDFGRLLAGWHENHEFLPLPELFDRIVSETKYDEYLLDGTEEGRSRWENVQELRRLTFDFEDRGLPPFLESLALISDQDTVADDADAPTLLTLHAAKGLEFPIVFIVGLDEGLLPHSRALENPTDLEELSEERRLFYVGLTRAMNRVYLVRAERRRAYGAQRSGGYTDSLPSQFLKHIPEEYILETAPRRSRRARSEEWDWTQPDDTRRYKRETWGGTHALRTFTSPPPGGHAPIIEPKFRPAMRVRHSTWGDGMVLESRIQDGDETVDVIFESVGFKRLVASLANLEILPGKSK